MTNDDTSAGSIPADAAASAQPPTGGSQGNAGGLDRYTVTLPSADAPPEEWREKLFSRLPEAMRPVASPADIFFARPEGLPEHVPYSEQLANASKPWMHEAGLSASQASRLHDRFAGFMAEQAAAQQQAVMRSVEQAHDALVRDWGPSDGDAFRGKLELADRAIRKLGLLEACKARGILLADGSLTDAQIARAFHAVGEAMFREDTIGAEGQRGGDNPFRRNAQGERNLMAISALVKSDPDRARRLARQAGENPDLWIASNPY